MQREQALARRLAPKALRTGGFGICRSRLCQLSWAMTPGSPAA